MSARGSEAARGSSGFAHGGDVNERRAAPWRARVMRYSSERRQEMISAAAWAASMPLLWSSSEVRATSCSRV